MRTSNPVWLRGKLASHCRSPACPASQQDFPSLFSSSQECPPSCTLGTWQCEPAMGLLCDLSSNTHHFLTTEVLLCTTVSLGTCATVTGQLFTLEKHSRSSVSNFSCCFQLHKIFLVMVQLFGS